MNFFFSSVYASHGSQDVTTSRKRRIHWSEGDTTTHTQGTSSPSVPHFFSWGFTSVTTSPPWSSLPTDSTRPTSSSTIVHSTLTFYFFVGGLYSPFPITLVLDGVRPWISRGLHLRTPHCSWVTALSLALTGRLSFTTPRNIRYHSSNLK